MILTQPALILNKHWIPIRVTTVREALIKLFEGRAKAVHSEDYSVYDFESWSQLRLMKNEPYLTLAKSTMRVPNVIVMSEYGGVPEPKVVFSRANLYRRDDHTCQYCGKKTSTSKLTIDHIVPRSRGGKSSWLNCVVACWDCNALKADKTANEVGLKLLRKPFKPEWTPKLVFKRVPNTPKNWEKFVSAAYWNTRLQEE